MRSGVDWAAVEVEKVETSERRQKDTQPCCVPRAESLTRSFSKPKVRGRVRWPKFLVVRQDE